MNILTPEVGLRRGGMNNGQMRRLTFPVDGRDNTHGYSYIPALNLDNTMALVLRGIPTPSRAVFTQFNPDSFTASGARRYFFGALPASGIHPDWELGVWSRTDPAIYYCAEGRDLWAYNVYTRAYTLVKNFDTEMSSTGRLYHLSMSHDGTRFAGLHTDTGFSPLGYLVYDVPTTTTLHYVANTAIDEVKISGDGAYLWIKKSPQNTGSRVLTIAGGGTVDLTYGTPDFSNGHYDVGTDYVVEYSSLNSIVKRPLATPHTYTEIFQMGADFSQDVSISLTGTDNVWAVVGFYNNVGGTFGANPSWNNRTHLLKMDGTQELNTLLDHKTYYQSYYDSIRNSRSYDGKFLVFTSTVGLPMRRDVYIYRMPT